MTTVKKVFQRFVHPGRWWTKRRRKEIQEISIRGIWPDAWVVETPPVVHSHARRWHRFLIVLYAAVPDGRDWGRLCYRTLDGEQVSCNVFEERVDEQARPYWSNSPMSNDDMRGFVVHLLLSGALPLTERRAKPPHSGAQAGKLSYPELQKSIDRLGDVEGQ